MAKASPEIIDVLRKTAIKIERSLGYQWGHMGSCNCGFLAQEITRLPKDQIHRSAMQSFGDWSEQLNDYCPASGLPFDDIIHAMLDFGFDAGDLKNLERLSDPNILHHLPVEKRQLNYNSQRDVSCYLIAWANLLEQQLLEKISIPDFRTMREKDQVIMTQPA